MPNHIAWSVSCVAVICGAAHAQTSLEGIADEVQDFGAKASSIHSWVPVPAVITEPAIGYGLGLALLYMSSSSPSAASDAPQDDSTIRSVPPNITGIGGFVTGTHSAGAAIGHTHSWADDQIRYLGAVGEVNLNLAYYGFAQDPHSYLLGGTAMVQQVLFRIGDGNWLVGPRYTFMDVRVSFDGAAPDAPGNFAARQRVAKGGVIFDYDSRDNIFYPTKGIFAEISPEISRPALGSSSSFETLSVRAFRWFPLSTSWVLAFRADIGFSHGDTPFFAKPYVPLRGVPAAKYQDTNQMTGETEVRWYANSKWSFLAFGGLGKAYGRLHGFSDSPTAYGFGSGVRYLIDRKLGLTMGLDIARGPQQNAFYVQLGSAWR